MKKELLAAGIILAACLLSISTEASTNRILISTPHSYSQNISNYTNITLGMADRERKEQEAWDRERWEHQEEKKREQDKRHHKKNNKRKNNSDFERQRKWKFDPSQSGGQGD